MPKPGQGGVLIDVLAAVAGVAAAWVVTDLVVALAEKRRPLAVSNPKNSFRMQVSGDERMQGAFHLGQAGWDLIYTAHHAEKTLRTKHKLYHGVQFAYGLTKLAYHILWAYPRHRAVYRGKVK